MIITANIGIISCAVVGVLFGAAALHAQTESFPLDSAEGLTLHNVKAEPVNYKGAKGLRVTMSDEAVAARQRASAASQEAPRAAKKAAEPGGRPVEFIAELPGIEFQDGVIEVELAGEPAADAGPQARGFVGIAFRIAPEERDRYECFYVRPANGRAGDQERRNHSVQYVSHPEYPWYRLRGETPSKYEAYVDLVPGEWTKVKIEVRGGKAKLFVHGNEQPTLIVNDLKRGADARGRVGLWIEGGTVAHFSNLRISR